MRTPAPTTSTSSATTTATSLTSRASRRRIHRTLALAGTAMLFGGAALAAAGPAQAAGAVLDPVQVERSCKTPGKSGSPDKAYYSSVVLRGSATGSSTFTFDSLTVQNNPALTQITPKQVTVPAGSTTTVTIQATGAKNSANGPAVLTSTVNQGGTTSQHTGTISTFAPMQTADCGVSYPSNVNTPWPVTNQQVVAVDFFGNQAAVPAAVQGGVASLLDGRSTSYALKTDGNVVAWDSTGPVTLPAGWTNLKSIDSSETMEGVPYRVAVTNAGTALVDGLDNSDQLTAATNLKSVAAGRGAAMGLTNDGTLIPAGYVWDSGAPAAVPAGLTNVVQIVSGYGDFVALKADGTVVVFSADGQTEAALSGEFTSIAAGRTSEQEFAALKADGTAVYWAFGSAPVVVATDATRVAIGRDHITGGDSDFTHVYVQHRDGTVDDTRFQDGGGQYGPTPVPALKGATSVVANNTGVVGLFPTA